MGEDFYEQSILPHRGALVKICRAYSTTQEEFEDNYQEVCLQLWRSKDNFKGQSSWSTWLYRVALNVCLTMGRQKKAEKSLDGQDVKDSRTALEAQMQESEELAALYSAIRHLRELDRALILLYLEERSYQEMADILGMSQSNIGVRISRIKEKLTQMISEKG